MHGIFNMLGENSSPCDFNVTFTLTVLSQHTIRQSFVGLNYCYCSQCILSKYKEIAIILHFFSISNIISMQPV